MHATTPASGFHMADVRAKQATARRAVAVGELHAGAVGEYLASGLNG